MNQKERWMRFGQGIMVGAMVVVILLMMAKCSNITLDTYNAKQANIEIRKVNDGVVPGKEIIGSDGTRYTIITFPDRPGIECINGYKRMACYTKYVK